jgi:hypothetical protein
VAGTPGRERAGTGRVVARPGRLLEDVRFAASEAPWRGKGRGPVQEEWSRKGATLSDKTARKEFGLTQDEIVVAIDAGQLQYRVGVIQGNPWLRLLRREV